MSYKFNPLTGQLDLVGTGGGNVADNIIVEYRTLNATEATNKQITLTNTPADATKTLLDIISGTTQDYGTDYQVIGNILSWNSLGLDVTLDQNDKIRITYPI